MMCYSKAVQVDNKVWHACYHGEGKEATSIMWQLCEISNILLQKLCCNDHFGSYDLNKNRS